MNKRLRTIFQYLFFFGLGVFLVWWSVNDLTADDKSQIKQALRTARYWLVFPVFIVLFSSHLVRALRWRLLMQSLGYHPSVANALFAVMIGYLTNHVVPRLGEVVKCTMLARYEKIPVDKLIGTIILERLIDAISLLFVFGITLIIQPDIYSDLTEAVFNSKPDPSHKTVSSLAVMLIAAGIIILIIVFWMIRKKKNFSDLGSLLKKIGHRIWQGVSAIQHLQKRKQFIFLTILLWALYLSGGYLGFMAFRETQGYGIREAFAVLSAGSIGMLATPGGIGAYSYLVEKTMIIYGLNTGIATAFGLILWVAQTSVILIGGLFSFVAMPFFNKRKQVEKN
ncbi:MAG TPA: lysylphosphatidylglycerol synthase transmembrane domain-containing protein [Chitinophagaceae bacterium]|nr:lysylphosphatidylglycerol synthase transmembrane domain-containing protein [Chitinophagaceae bacterium]